MTVTAPAHCSFFTTSMSHQHLNRSLSNYGIIVDAFSSLVRMRKSNKTIGTRNKSRNTVRR